MLSNVESSLSYMYTSKVTAEEKDSLVDLLFTHQFVHESAEAEVAIFIPGILPSLNRCAQIRCVAVAHLGSVLIAGLVKDFSIHVR